MRAVLAAAFGFMVVETALIVVLTASAMFTQARPAYASTVYLDPIERPTLKMWLAVYTRKGDEPGTFKLPPDRIEFFEAPDDVRLCVKEQVKGQCRTLGAFRAWVESTTNLSVQP